MFVFFTFRKLTLAKEAGRGFDVANRAVLR